MLYGKRHAQRVKALCAAGKSIAAIDTFPGLSEAVGDVTSLLATEQKEYQNAQQ